MRHVFLSLGLAAAVAGLALPADASVPSSPRAKMMFWFIDRNADGYIDVTEVEAVRTARFKALDQNGDGTLTRAEASAAFEAGRAGHRGGKDGKAGKQAARAERMEKREAAYLKRLGFTDSVDSLTVAEFVAVPSRLLKTADADGDGKISQAEFLAVRGKARSAN